MTVIGIDPGKNGAIAWITEGSPCVEKMPDTLQDLWELLQSIQTTGSPQERLNKACFGFRAYIESVSSSPQMGVVSAFSFGRGLGNLEMALTAAGIPFERVRPQQWQKDMGCLTKGNKNISKAKAQELFPSLKVTHAIADGLLICEWGRRFGK
jgi:hypothetical protein